MLPVRTSWAGCGVVHGVQPVQRADCRRVGVPDGHLQDGALIHPNRPQRTAAAALQGAKNDALQQATTEEEGPPQTTAIRTATRNVHTSSRPL